MKGIAWVGVSIGQMKVQRGSGNPTTNAFFILVASRYAYSTYVFFFFFDRFFCFFVSVLGFPPLVPAVQTRLFYEPGQPPGVYGALFRVASPPPPPVSQNKSSPLEKIETLSWKQHPTIHCMEGKIKNIVGKKIFGDLGKKLDQQTVGPPDVC